MESYGLGTLFRKENPYEKRVKTAAAVAEKSGFARPLLYAAMGEDMARAEQWDTDREAETAKYLSGKAENEQAKSVMENVFKVAEFDPEGATMILKGAAEKIPQLQPFQSINFYAKSNKDWHFVTDGEGQPFAVSKQGLAWLSANPDKAFGEDGRILPDVAKKIFVPYGAKKAEGFTLGQGQTRFDAEGNVIAEVEAKAEAPKTRSYQKGGLEVTEEFQPDGTWKEVGRGNKWPPKGEGDPELRDIKKEISKETLQKTRLQNLVNEFAMSNPEAVDKDFLTGLLSVKPDYLGSFRQFAESRSGQTQGRPTVSPKAAGNKPTILYNPATRRFE